MLASFMVPVLAEFAAENISSEVSFASHAHKGPGVNPGLLLRFNTLRSGNASARSGSSPTSCASSKSRMVMPLPPNKEGRFSSAGGKVHVKIFSVVVVVVVVVEEVVLMVVVVTDVAVVAVAVVVVTGVIIGSKQ